MNRNIKKILVFSLIIVMCYAFTSLVSAETFNNYNPTQVTSCGLNSKTGEYLITNIPIGLPKVLTIIYNVIQVAIPVVLVITGSLDFVKALSAQKEDEMKKNQNLFIKRLISAVIIFFVFVLVKLLIGVVADSNGNGTPTQIVDCASCFIRNTCG